MKKDINIQKSKPMTAIEFNFITEYLFCLCEIIN